MNSTWIIIISFLAFLVFLVIVKLLWSYFEKNKPPKTPNKQVKEDLSYETNFIKLDALLILNQNLQKNESNENISKLNNYVRRKLADLISCPEYIFNKHLQEFHQYLVELIEVKLLKNSPVVWDKKFVNEIAMFHFKTQEFENQKNDLKTLKMKYQDKILAGWIENKTNSSC